VGEPTKEAEEHTRHYPDGKKGNDAGRNKIIS
jgi:hypothetical protein